MNIFKKIAAVVSAAAMAACCLAVTASAEIDVVTKAKDSVVLVASSDGYYLWTGTGFCIGKTGEDPEYVVTNAHVVCDDSWNVLPQLSVVFSQKANKYVTPDVKYINKDKDICILRLPEPTSERVPIKIADPDTVDVTDTIYALGYPDYGEVDQDNTYDASDIMVTKGIISKRTETSGNLNSTTKVDTFMSDVTISHGNSGGPSINETGAVIGINTAITVNFDQNGSFIVTCDELIRALNSEGIPYEMESKGGLPVAVIIAIAAVVVIGVGVVVIVVLSRKKKAVPVGAPAQAAGGYAAPAPAPVPHVGAAAIVGVSGNFKGSTFVINSGLVVGRNPQKCSVCFPVDTKGVSGVHCEIRMNGASIVLMDCGSSNGTFLGNGQRLQPNVPVAVANGTYFYLGSSEQMFQIKNV